MPKWLSWIFLFLQTPTMALGEIGCVVVLVVFLAIVVSLSY